MKDTAKILSFKGRELKTVRDLQAAQLALFQDITSGAVTPAESLLVQKDLSARLWEFEASLRAAKARGALKSPLTSAIASGDLAGNKEPNSNNRSMVRQGSKRDRATTGFLRSRF